MMYPIPFRAAHVRQMDIQPTQSHVAGIADDRLEALEGVYANTLVEDGKPLSCAGAVPLTEGRAMVWAILSNRVTPQNFKAVFAWSKLWLRSLPFHRLEASVELDFLNGHRMLKALGFYLEVARAKAYSPGRVDSSLYVMVK